MSIPRGFTRTGSRTSITACSRSPRFKVETDDDLGARSRAERTRGFVSSSRTIPESSGLIYSADRARTTRTLTLATLGHPVLEGGLGLH